MQREEKVRSLRDLAFYVADKADEILVPTEVDGRPKMATLSELPAKDALSHMAAIVNSGKVPFIKGS